jgi:hypothetical protein
VQSFVQDAIDMSVAHPDMTWSDFMKERPGRALVTSGVDATPVPVCDAC